MQPNPAVVASSFARAFCFADGSLRVRTESVMSLTCRLGQVVVLSCRTVQATENPAIRGCPTDRTTLPQSAEFLLQRLQFLDAGHDMANVCVQQLVNLRAAFRGSILVLQ